MFTGLIITKNVKYFSTISGALNTLTHNLVPDIAIDKWGGDDSFGDRAVTQHHSFTETLALEDFYRVSNLSGKIFTWFNGPHSVGCRLDRFYTR